MEFQKILVATVIAICSFSAQAKNEYSTIPAMPVEEITQKIISVATQYADSISCGDTQIQPKEIAALTPWKDDTDRFEAKYAVIWHNDIGCWGGAGSSSTNISIVKIGAGNSFYVDPESSSPVVGFDPGARFIERIVGSTKDSIVLEALFHADYDSNNFPSTKRKVTVKVDDKGNWFRD
ncbi:hypothetical protein [Larsenimonas salina]|uniref:hypothetical protein n=1 Tax=Larsenimonas salina TaxID=1295565 RepID=UPI0020743578|nr:hypothetical protein [Larsenimonas salina]MCM5704559.1 hypothetical protein [Larsenimonas salina]